MEENISDEYSIPPMEVQRFYCKFDLLREPYRRSDLCGDYILVIFGYYKLIGSHSRRRVRPIIWDSEILIDKQEFWFHLPSLKRENREWNPDYYRHKCRRMIFSSLVSMGVPESERSKPVSEFFQAVEVVVSPDRPIDVSLWDTTLRLEDYYEDFNLVPATSSSIEGLERVRLDSLDFATRSLPCPICLEDFEEPGGGADQLLPRLPCSHHFHLHCIISWLEKSRLCPVCRYPMPTNN